MLAGVDLIYCVSTINEFISQNETSDHWPVGP